MSPLHFRHGCIIVRGGKVIGQGYNDHRPHFDGGAKKSASSSACNGDAIVAPAQKNKRRNKTSNEKHRPLKQNEDFSEKSSSTGDANEICPVNAPLSMHSEMMAIYSALSRSSNSASKVSIHSARWLQKPCFKLSGRGKRDLRLQNLKAYVKRAIAEGVIAEERESAGKQYRGGSQVQTSCFETGSSQRGQEEGERGISKREVRGRGVREREEARESEEEYCERSEGRNAGSSSRRSCSQSDSNTWRDCATWAAAAAA